MRHEPVKRKLSADGDVVKSTEISCPYNFTDSGATKFHIIGAADPAVTFHRTMVCARRLPQDLHVLWFCGGRSAFCLARRSDTRGIDFYHRMRPEAALDANRFGSRCGVSRVLLVVGFELPSGAIIVEGSCRVCGYGGSGSRRLDSACRSRNQLALPSGSSHTL